MYYWGGRIKQYEMGEVCGDFGSKEMQTGLWWGNLTEGNHLEA